ncbi:MAG: aspartate--ammonia ligase [Ruminococcaceae bacterium]|nr:aspartate--ammonia ligase [Oscillospiraceae bacterium]
MSHPLIIPEGYKSALSLRETQHAVKYIKDIFQQALSFALTLDRVTAPIIVTKDSGINDDLSGVERKVEFSMKEIGGNAEVVQSLAKWKRTALYKYDYQPDEGIYTDMNAIRRDDDVDNIHSIFVDQWDWEKIITSSKRNLDYLKSTVEAIVKAISYTKRKVNRRYPLLRETITEDVFFITSQELEDMYPDLTSKERERTICREHKTVFIMQIGWPLRSGEKHDNRAPDYDDWMLNGDLLLWNSVLDNALEISSMGIRVDSESLKKQLDFCNMNERLRFDYHSMIADGKLPLTIGGGIGQSRLCMLLLEKAHIGEVQVSIWPDDMVEKCREAGIKIL